MQTQAVSCHTNHPVCHRAYGLAGACRAVPGVRQVTGHAKGFWAAKVLSVSAKAGALIWHRHFNLKKVAHELKRAADEVRWRTLQGRHAAVLVQQEPAMRCVG